MFCVTLTVMVTQYFTPYRHFGGYPFANGFHFRHRGIILYHLHGSIFTLLNDKWQWTARTTAETSANHITPVQALQLYQCLPSIKHTSNYQKKTKASVNQDPSPPNPTDKQPLSHQGTTFCNCANFTEAWSALTGQLYMFTPWSMAESCGPYAGP